MKKLLFVTLLSLINTYAMGSCSESYRSAGENFLELPDVDSGEAIGVVGTSITMDVLSMSTNFTTVPVFSISGVVYTISVSVDWFQRRDYRMLEDVLKDARAGAYSSDMDDLHEFVEDNTGLSISEDELQDVIVKLDDKNAFCTNGVQGVKDFKHNIARNFERR